MAGPQRDDVAWVRERLQQLTSYEEVLADRLAEAYGEAWPAERIRVDATAHANWAGGYTTNNPDHVTISSSDYQGLHGLEILFHEVSHASFFEQEILRQVDAAFRSYEIDPPGRLSHAIQFATPAELVRSLLNENEGAVYGSLAERVYEGGRFAEQYLIVLEHWRAFLAGRTGRAEALARIAGALATGE